MPENLIYPNLYCPFASAINQHAEAVNRQTLKWVTRFQLVTGEAYQQVQTAQIGWLVGKGYPNAPQEELQIISDWCIWFAILDDLSEVMVGQPEKLASLYGRFLAILQGAEVKAEEGPLGRGLVDIRERLVAKANPEWMERWLAKVEECWNSWVWQANNRVKGIVPDLATYLKMRPLSSGFFIGIEMIEVVEKINLPPPVREHPVVQSLLQLTNHVLSYANDIFSLEKEMKQGDPHNLVLVLHHELGLSLQASLNRAVEIHNSQVQAFIDLKSSLPSFGEAADRELKCYLSELGFMMGGHLDWLQASGRYSISQ